jgi:leucyl-tRNA---protein transferase
MLAPGIYLSPEHDCGYFDGRVARELLVLPRGTPDAAGLERMLMMGFRRSGEHLYRPECNGCQACTPLRTDVHAFRPDRSMRRCLKRNRDLSLRLAPAAFSEEHWLLYRRYVAVRHPGGGMDSDDREAATRFLLSPWPSTRLLEFRLAGSLVAVAVTDIGSSALSAAYTFFDPDHHARGLGTYAILRQIALARRHGLRWLYLGFWIDGHPKMHYKARFGPVQILRDGHWRPLPRTPAPARSSHDQQGHERIQEWSGPD